MTLTVSLFFLHTRAYPPTKASCVGGMGSKTLCYKVLDRKKQAGREKKRRPQANNKRICNKKKKARETEVRGGGRRGSQWYFELTTEPVNCCCHCFRDATSHSSSTQLQTYKRRTQRESERWTPFRSPPISPIFDMTEEAAVSHIMPWTPKPTFWGTYWPKLAARKQKRKGQRTALPESFW